jgi:S1-C subfamily serine protease
MYVEAIRKEAEKETIVELPQIWTGTGFALTNNYVVTNYHVIENAKIITLTGINGNFSIKHNASVAATDKNNDLALLKLNGNVSITNIPYSIKTTTSDVGEEIFVLGYPLTATMGDEIKLTTGVISSKSGFQGDISQYQISAPIQPGNSGGPLFDSKGNIIGIVSAKHAGAENVGYAIKTSYLKTLVESVTSTNVLPQANRIATQNLSGKVKAVKNYVYYIKCTQ